MNVPQATHSGELKIGDIRFTCFVLTDGRRILSQRGVLGALGRSGSIRGGTGGGDKLPPFLAQNNLKPFISKDLMMATSVVQFWFEKHLIFGYSAEILPGVSEVYLKARDANALYQSQTHIAEQAEILLRGFAHVGIAALVDEATNYQEIRDKATLQAILDRYLTPTRAAWAKAFPDEFYKEIFRLKGWAWQGMNINRPQVVGYYTNDIVYARLAPGLLGQLELFNPRMESGEREGKHHQHLTREVGYLELMQHLHGAIAIMNTVTHHDPERAWSEFKRRLQRWRPRINTNLDLDLPDTED